MSEEVEAMGILWKAGLGIMGVIGWLMNRSIKRLDKDIESHSSKLDDHDKQHAHCTLELANFKTEVAKEYAKDVTVQQSLGRIHDRIDDVATDIKTLLQRGLK